MKASNPPRLAVWLLKHFGPEINLEALTGDLHEGFSQGKSKAWYWRQVLAAIPWHTHLRELVIAAGFGWAMTWFWGNSQIVSRPLDTAIFTAVFFTMSYLPGMLRGKQRAMLAALIVIFWGWLYRYHSELAHHYSICGFWLVSSLLFYRKKPEPSPHHLTWREMIMGDPDAERERLIASLNLALLRETDPELRQAYAQSIAALRSRASAHPSSREPLVSRPAAHIAGNRPDGSVRP